MIIGVIGLGTVGFGTVDILTKEKERLEKTIGEEVVVKYGCALEDVDLPDGIIYTQDYHEVINDENVDVVVELIGGTTIAKKIILDALNKKKHVVTANKALIAHDAKELFTVARENGVNLYYEASVGGGIPVVVPAKEDLVANNINKVEGILNGTTNYMLTKMEKEGADFDTVLKDAQDKGYAEKDPTADIEGHDPCRKIAILTSLVCGQQIDFEDIHCEGITKISAIDFKYAEVMGRSIKLLASSRKVGGSYSCMVAPFMLSKDHPLCGVNGVFNGIFVHGNVLGDAMFYGSGAGKLPTASAVVADVVDMVKHKNTNIYIDWKPEKLELVDYKDSRNSFFVRTSSDKDTIAKAFGEVTYVSAGIEGETGFTTGEMTEAEFEENAAEINLINRIRLG